MLRLMRHSILAFCLALAACQTTSPPPSPPDALPGAEQGLVVRVQQGQLRGREVNGVFTFRGIPYAAPPVGTLRWEPPQPALSWAGVRDAAAFGPMCAQTNAHAPEDCLTLNVWTPAAHQRAHLSVMVWVHGGGFTNFGGGTPIYDGTPYAQRGVILVTINYRLGIFGFFSHPELTAESPHHASGNYGLADQVAALQWVRQNIAAFGGDPRHITLIGQSAGSISVIDLMASPLGRRLIHGAIAESGTPLVDHSMMSLSEAEQQGAKFALAQSATSLADLRAMSADELIQRWSAAGARSRPIIDGWILPEAPARVFAQHREAHVPLLIGSNARENQGVGPTAANLSERLHATFGSDLVRAQALYPADGSVDPLLGDSASRFATDTEFRCPAVVIESWHALHAAVYAYQFEEPFPGRASMGAQHSDEVFFVFDTLKNLHGAVAPSEQSKRLAQTMVDYWSNFAKTGDPNGAGTPNWPRFTFKGHEFIHLNSADVRSDANLRREACELFAETLGPNTAPHRATP